MGCFHKHRTQLRVAGPNQTGIRLALTAGGVAWADPISRNEKPREPHLHSRELWVDRRTRLCEATLFLLAKIPTLRCS
jgi:hypothetical protein